MQKVVGRLALGAYVRILNGAVQGDMGWSSIEAREASSRIWFDQRLTNMEDKRWAKNEPP